MFAVLPTMDLSSGCRPSTAISPAHRPTVPPPPPLIPISTTNDIIKSESTNNLPRFPTTPTTVTNLSFEGGERQVKLEPERQDYNSENGRQGNAESNREYRTASKTNDVTIDTKRDAPAATSHIATPTLPAIEPNLSIPQNISLQQLSLLSQQMFATMISLQRLQQSNAATSLGNLLPPPPDLSTGSDPGKVSINTAYTSNTSGAMRSTGVQSPSAQSHTSQSSNGSFSNNVDNELPLDLSKPANDKGAVKRRSSPPMNSSSITKRRYDANSIASIRSNFPTLLSNKNSSAKKRKSQSPSNVTNYSGLAPMPNFANSYPASSSQAHTTISAADSGNPIAAQLQLQNWLLAAMSVQKMQQIALGRSVLMHDAQAKQDAPQIEPKKRKLDEPQQMFSNYRPRYSTPENADHPQYAQVNARKSPCYPQPHGANRTAGSPSIKASRSSPNSDNSQPGKRYRRYAKPPYSYVSLITLAILSSRDKKLRLSQILKRISEMFPFFNGTYQGWRDSVRHNLSQNECFVKVLKNPYRPTAKGNFWTVNLNSIPHELLLRQNTLVSRYAQDSGYRYRKDLTEVFNLRTGALKVSVPRHLLKNAEQPRLSMLCDDPAAVMESILLEETEEDDIHDVSDKITPDQRQFTLEDLFAQSHENDDDLLLQSGRSRAARIRQKSATVITHLPQAPSKRTVFPESHYDMSSLQGENSGSNPFGVATQKESGNPPPLYSSLSNGNTNPFAAHQTAVLARALSCQIPGLGLASLISDRNTQMPRECQDSEDQASVKTTRTPPALLSYSADIQNDVSSANKKSKRKGAQPTRRKDFSDINMNSIDENSAELGYAENNMSRRDGSISGASVLLQHPNAQQHLATFSAANQQPENTMFQPAHAVDSPVPASQM